MLPFICHVLKDHDFNSLRNGTFWSVILDESTDITFNKNLCLLSKTRSETTLIGIVSINDGRGVTIANATKELFEKYCIPLANCCGIGSDGASCMIGHVNGFVKFWQDMVRDARGDKGAQDSVIQVHYISHRVALAITDLYSLKGDEGKFLASVDQLCRVAYSFFARSIVNKKEYMKLQSTFSKLKLPNSLCETRWIGRYRCIATLDDYGKAMQQFIHDNFRHRSITEGAFIREFYNDHVSDLHDLRRILHIMWRISQRTQQKNLSLWRAFVYALSAQDHISELTELGPLGKKLAKEFVSLIAKRFLWMMLVRLCLLIFHSYLREGKSLAKGK